MEQRIIVDFDNTMGVRGCDVDDGLALLYLVGCDDVRIEGVCTTYGNSRLDVVHENTAALLDTWGLDVPLLRGGANPHDLESEAARFIAETTSAHPGGTAIVATGSLTNLRGAQAHDACALDRARSISLMGGITQSLVINGRIMNELNFSCDAAAAKTALKASCPVAVATAQNCLPAYFTHADLTRTFGEASWLVSTCSYWFEDMRAAYASEGWVCWDVVAAAWAVRPELFDERPFPVVLNERLLSAGYLERAAEGAPQATVNLPAIRDAAAFKRHVLETWQNGLAKLGLA